MYLRPRTVEDALQALATYGGRILAGGTDFFPALGDKPVAGPVIDISGLGGLANIAVSDEEVRIGACTTWRTVAEASLPRAFNSLRAAAREVGAIQIQHVGTVGGNLCTASPAADGVPPLLALDAEVELACHNGHRRLPLRDFIASYRKTLIRADEILTAIVVPRTIEGPSTFLRRSTISGYLDRNGGGCGGDRHAWQSQTSACRGGCLLDGGATPQRIGTRSNRSGSPAGSRRPGKAGAPRDTFSD